MQIHIQSRRRADSTLRRDHPSASIVDLTSRAGEPWVRFSPFYPHGGIPVPMSPGVCAQSVEGVWQGLKVFKDAGVDVSKFDVTSMKGLKRTVRRFGPVRGHAAGVASRELLAYRDARYQIYLPCYRWVLEHRLQAPLAELRRLAETSELVLLDYETNGEVDRLDKPLSHAALVRAFLMDAWPSRPPETSAVCDWRRRPV